MLLHHRSHNSSWSGAGGALLGPSCLWSCTFINIAVSYYALIAPTQRAHQCFFCGSRMHLHRDLTLVESEYLPENLEPVIICYWRSSSYDTQGHPLFILYRTIYVHHLHHRYTRGYLSYTAEICTVSLWPVAVIHVNSVIHLSPFTWKAFLLVGVRLRVHAVCNLRICLSAYTTWSTLDSINK